MDKPKRAERNKQRQGPRSKGLLGWLRARTWIAAVLVGVVALAGIFVFAGAVLGPKAGPRVSFKQESFDYGKVPYGQTVQAVYELRNTGDLPLKVEDLSVKVVEGC